MDIVFGLLTALGWGTTDVVVRLVGLRLGVLRSMFFGQCVGLIVLTFWLVLHPQSVEGSASGWIAAVLAALLNLGATAALFRGLSVGRIALISPVTASYGAVTALLAAASGEAFTVSTAAGVGVTVAGVMIASSRSDRGASDTSVRPGLPWALLAAACFGVGSWLMGTFAVPGLGPVLPVWIYYLLGAATLMIAAFASGNRLEPPRAGSLLLVLALGALGSVSFIAFSARIEHWRCGGRHGAQLVIQCGHRASRPRAVA
ncbi:MAG TPA: EamA family transporter [Acetobacteraceae bacterium]|nr:EamA family transporter [Acetobacteraceae bacterium]